MKDASLFLVFVLFVGCSDSSRVSSSVKFELIKGNTSVGVQIVIDDSKNGREELAKFILNELNDHRDHSIRFSAEHQETVPIKIGAQTIPASEAIEFQLGPYRLVSEPENRVRFQDAETGEFVEGSFDSVSAAVDYLTEQLIGRYRDYQQLIQAR